MLPSYLFLVKSNGRSKSLPSKNFHHVSNPLFSPHPSHQVCSFSYMSPYSMLPDTRSTFHQFGTTLQFTSPITVNPLLRTLPLYLLSNIFRKICYTYLRLSYYSLWPLTNYWLNRKTLLRDGHHPPVLVDSSSRPYSHSPVDVTRSDLQSTNLNPPLFNLFLTILDILVVLIPLLPLSFLLSMVNNSLMLYNLWRRPKYTQKIALDFCRDISSILSSSIPYVLFLL